MRSAIIVIVTCLAGITQLPAQKILKSATLEAKLEQATRISETNPPKAISILNEVISKALKKKRPDLVSRSYAILGDIYHNINQHELAIERYMQSLHHLEQHKTEFNPTYNYLKAELYLKIGETHLHLKDYPAAEGAFHSGIALTKDSTQLLLLHEGILELSLIHI